MNEDARRALGAVLERPRYEVFPLEGRLERIAGEVAAHVPPRATVTVTASPSRGMAPTLALAGMLARRGYRAVPHLSARLIADEVEVKEILDRLDAAGISEAFVVGGDPDRQAGVYGDAHALLVAMDRLGHRFREIGVAGYPEPHPAVSDEAAMRALHDKQRYVTYLVSQMCFEAAAIAAWVRRLRRGGIALPVYVGLPGPVGTARLLRLSRRVGVGESVRFLGKHGPGMARLARPGRYSPDAVAYGIAPYLADPGYGIAGLHIYTFNEVAATEEWRRATTGRLHGAPAAGGDRGP